MPSRDELEDRLIAREEPVTLAVYADLLQAEGDLRGELIAVELAIAGGAHHLAERRDELVHAWLGPLPSEGVEVRHGFVHFDLVMPPSNLEHHLAVLQRAGPGVMTVRSGGSRFLTELARVPRPMLEALHLEGER